MTQPAVSSQASTVQEPMARRGGQHDIDGDMCPAEGRAGGPDAADPLMQLPDGSSPGHWDNLGSGSGKPAVHTPSSMSGSDAATSDAATVAPVIFAKVPSGSVLVPGVAARAQVQPFSRTRLTARPASVAVTTARASRPISPTSWFWASAAASAF